jgi:hypothetical protein
MLRVVDRTIEPGEKRNYTALIESANKAMLEKLKENEHKNGWDGIDIGYTTKRIFDEYLELCKEVGIRNTREIRREAADVANFAAMIIYQCDKKLKEESK